MQLNAPRRFRKFNLKRRNADVPRCLDNRSRSKALIATCLLFANYSSQADNWSDCHAKENICTRCCDRHRHCGADDWCNGRRPWRWRSRRRRSRRHWTCWRLWRRPRLRWSRFCDGPRWHWPLRRGWRGGHYGRDYGYRGYGFGGLYGYGGFCLPTPIGTICP